MNKLVFGHSGEDYAARLLQGLGFKILSRNFRTKLGEIDIIALKDDELNFVEVKTRSSEKYGKPEEAVTPAKIRTISKVAELYMRLHPSMYTKMKIIVVALEMENGRLKSEKIISAV